MRLIEEYPVSFECPYTTLKGSLAHHFANIMVRIIVGQ